MLRWTGSQDHVGPLPAHGLHGTAPTGGRDDLDVLGRAENEFEAGTDQCLVVHHHNPDHALRLTFVPAVRPMPTRP
ncbi:hypothetical protein SUDANB96_03868 [Streptomyces sp. enrichment culture]